MIPVNGHTNLYRDERSGAIINCDFSSYNQYMVSCKNKKMQQYEIEKIKKDIDEIKTLLMVLINESK